MWSSAVLAASLRDLPFQWEEVFAYRPLLAETFTDPETHAGTCYKAAGWEAVGMSSGQGKHCADLYPGRARPKKLWLKALEPKARETLCAAELPAAQQAGLAAHAGVRCALKTPQLRSLYDVFSKARDPRRRHARRYPIGAGLTLTALGLLCGAVHLSTIVRTAQKLTRAQRRQLRLPRKKATRFYSVPCYDVFGDVLHRIDLQILAERLTGWLQSQAGELPAHLGHRWKNHSRPPGPDRRLGRHRRGHSCGLGGQREGQRPRTQNDPRAARLPGSQPAPCHGDRRFPCTTRTRPLTSSPAKKEATTCSRSETISPPCGPWPSSSWRKRAPFFFHRRRPRTHRRATTQPREHRPAEHRFPRSQTASEVPQRHHA